MITWKPTLIWVTTKGEEFISFIECQERELMDIAGSDMSPQEIKQAVEDVQMDIAAFFNLKED